MSGAQDYASLSAVEADLDTVMTLPPASSISTASSAPVPAGIRSHGGMGLMSRSGNSFSDQGHSHEHHGHSHEDHGHSHEFHGHSHGHHGHSHEFHGHSHGEEDFYDDMEGTLEDLDQDALADALLAMGIEEMANGGTGDGRGEDQNDEEHEEREKDQQRQQGDKEKQDNDPNVTNFQSAARNAFRELFQQFGQDPSQFGMDLDEDGPTKPLEHSKKSPFRTVVDNSDDEDDEIMEANQTRKETTDASTEDGDDAEDEDEADSNEEDDSSADSDEDQDDGLCYPTQIFFAVNGVQNSTQNGLQEIGALSATKPEQIVLSLDQQTRSVDIEYSFFATGEDTATIVAAVSIPVDQVRAELRTSALPRGPSTQTMLLLTLQNHLAEGSFLAQEMMGENAFEEVSDWTDEKCASRADAIVVIGRTADLIDFAAIFARQFPESGVALVEGGTSSSQDQSDADNENDVQNAKQNYRTPAREGALIDSDDEDELEEVSDADMMIKNGDHANRKTSRKKSPTQEDDNNANMPPFPSDDDVYEPLPVTEQDILAAMLEGGLQLQGDDPLAKLNDEDLQAADEFVKALLMDDDDDEKIEVGDRKNLGTEETNDNSNNNTDNWKFGNDDNYENDMIDTGLDMDDDSLGSDLLQSGDLDDDLADVFADLGALPASKE